MIYVGVDLGTKGGIVAVDDKENIVFAEAMPVIETVTQARKKIRSRMVKTAYGMVCAKFPLIVYCESGEQHEAKLKRVDGRHCAVYGKGKTKRVLPLDRPLDGVVAIGQVSKKTEVRDVVHHFPDFVAIKEIIDIALPNACGMDICVCVEGAFTNGCIEFTNMHTIAVMNQYHGSIVTGFTTPQRKPDIVPPKVWQKTYWQHIPEDTKKEGIRMCEEIFQHDSVMMLTRTDDRGKSYMHDGLCDAALIALYCKRKHG